VSVVGLTSTVDDNLVFRRAMPEWDCHQGGSKQQNSGDQLFRSSQALRSKSNHKEASPICTIGPIVIYRSDSRI